MARCPVCDAEDYHRLDDGSSRCLACGFEAPAAEARTKEAWGARFPAPRAPLAPTAEEARRKARSARTRRTAAVALYAVGGFLVAASRLGRVMDNEAYELATAVPAIGMIVAATVLWYLSR